MPTQVPFESSLTESMWMLIKQQIEKERMGMFVQTNVRTSFITMQSANDEYTLNKYGNICADQTKEKITVSFYIANRSVYRSDCRRLISSKLCPF